MIIKFVCIIFPDNCKKKKFFVEVAVFRLLDMKAAVWAPAFVSQAPVFAVRFVGCVFKRKLRGLTHWRRQLKIESFLRGKTKTFAQLRMQWRAGACFWGGSDEMDKWKQQLGGRFAPSANRRIKKKRSIGMKTLQIPVYVVGRSTKNTFIRECYLSSVVFF